MITKEIEAFQNRTFVMDCPVMQLTQEATDNPKTYRGPGSIFQKPDGSLHFILFVTGCRHIKQRMDISKSQNVGRLFF